MRPAAGFEHMTYYLPEKEQADPQYHRLTLGIAGLGGVWHDVPENASVEAILYALEKGVGAVDVAPSYNQGEAYLGKALRQWSGRPPFISTKVGRLKAGRADINLYDYTPEGIRGSVYNSLSLLGVNAVDLLFLHEPSGLLPAQAPAAIDALLQLKEEKLARQLGIGGNYPSWFVPLIKPGVFDVFMGYNRLNACNLSALHQEVPLMQSQHIRIYAGSPLHMGLLGRRFSDWVAQRPAWISATDAAHAQSIRQIAESQQMSLASLSIRFLKALSAADTIVIGPSNLEEVKDCLEVWQAPPLPAAIFQQMLSIHM